MWNSLPVDRTKIIESQFARVDVNVGVDFYGNQLTCLAREIESGNNNVVNATSTGAEV